MLRGVAHFTFRDCYISAISEKLCIYLAFWSCLKEMYFLIRFALVLKFLIGNQNLLSKIHLEFEKCETWSRKVKRREYLGHETLIPAPASCICSHLLHEVEFLETFLIDFGIKELCQE